jgi:hypothetical protein
MTDEEFDELLNKLHRIAMNDGDLGGAYWSKVILQLRELRALAQKSEKPIPTEKYRGQSSRGSN